MMTVHLKVALTVDYQTEASVHGESGEHMVKESYACVDFNLSAVKTQCRADIGFLGCPFVLCGSHKPSPPFNFQNRLT